MLSQATQPAYRIGSIHFVTAYIVTMRPYLLFVSGVTALAGLAHVPAVHTAGTVLVFIAGFLSYGFGQALTDCFQTDTDSISAPYRPLTRSVITKRQVFVVSLGGLIFCTLAFAFLSIISIAFGAAAVSGLATYTLFKRRWWGGPWYNAWIVVVLCLMAYTAGLHAETFSQIEIVASFAWTLATVFFGYANFVLTGYFKDIRADRETGYNTLPVVFGLRPARYASDLLAGLTIVSAAMAMADFPGSVREQVNIAASLAFLVGGIIAGVVGQLRLHEVETEEDAHRAIVPVVHSYILLLAAISSFLKPEWAPLLVLFYLTFVVVLNLRPARNQI